MQLVEYNHAYGICDYFEINADAVQARYLGMADHEAALNGLSPEKGNIMCSPSLLEHVQGKCPRDKSSSSSSVRPGKKATCSKRPWGRADGGEKEVTEASGNPSHPGVARK